MYHNIPPPEKIDTSFNLSPVWYSVLHSVRCGFSDCHKEDLRVTGGKRFSQRHGRESLQKKFSLIS